MSTEIQNPAIKPAKPAANAEGPAKPGHDKPKKPGQDDKSKKPDPKAEKPKPKLHPLHTYAGTVGTYGANPDGVYDRFELATAEGPRAVKFPPHFGEALHAAAQPGQAVQVLAFPHTTPKGDEHLHLASLDADGRTLRPQPAGAPADAVSLHGLVTELLLDPKGHLRAVRLEGEAAELRFPPHLGQQLADYLVVGTAVQASAVRRADRPGEVRSPGAPAPLQLELLTVAGESFLVR
ncbi:hypothetical protein [Hymenobacter nivis]|uniref:Uncharacterized protein n=1 Tax=Hymenobacter nivis TaxID=1850093 RepID=A0A502HEV9_9BACT|nr:hypothetical protein [Hymenobacter nivis]TPG72205.1 hypothetical protein EAH73_02925 [Hymenobacter nivis]